MDATTERDGSKTNNHENVLDSETYANKTFGKNDPKASFDLFSTTVPICRNIPARIHIEVVLMSLYVTTLKY